MHKIKIWRKVIVELKCSKLAIGGHKVTETIGLEDLSSSTTVFQILILGI